MRKKIEIEVLQNQKAELTSENRRLKEEADRLTRVLVGAKQLVAAYEQQVATAGTTAGLYAGVGGQTATTSYLTDDSGHSSSSRGGGVEYASRLARSVLPSATRAEHGVQPSMSGSHGDGAIRDQQQQDLGTQLAVIQLLRNQLIANLLSPQPTGLATLSHLPPQQPQQPQQSMLDNRSLINLAMPQQHQAQGVDISLLQSLQQAPSIPGSSLSPGLGSALSRDISSFLRSGSGQPLEAQLQQQQAPNIPSPFSSIHNAGLTALLSQQYPQSLASQQQQQQTQDEQDQKTSSSELTELLRLQQLHQPSQPSLDLHQQLHQPTHPSLDLHQQQRQPEQQQPMEQPSLELLEMLRQGQQQQVQQQQPQDNTQQQDQSDI